MRLDEEIVNRGLLKSRSKAKELIKNKKVKVNGKTVIKPSFKTVPDDMIEIMAEKVYVSRAAWKLKNYIEKYGMDMKDKLVLDIGSSTGGFSEVCLEKGARVVGVDVGSAQLDDSLRDKMEIFEKTDIREFFYPEKFDMIVSDVSFISLLKIIGKIDTLIDKGDIILLFKPQFEVGRDVKRDKKGVVTDERAVLKAMHNFEKETDRLGWKLIRSEESSIKGKEGNREFIYHFVKGKQ